jgi:NAD-dependent deacetylase
VTDVASAAEVLAGRHRILVFTGAGISTESGIPDFRGPDGLWTRLDPNDYTYARYLDEPAFRVETWERRFDSPFRGAKPNAAHHAVTALYRAKRAVGCITQNVDGLHAAADLPAAALVELHGNASELHCIGCGHEPDLEETESRWRAGEADPPCRHCGGILKTRVVFFGEDMPRREMIRATAMVDEADSVLVIGSTLSVDPAAFLPLEVVERGGPMVIVNQGITDHDRLATVKVDGPAGSIVPALVSALVAPR